MHKKTPGLNLSHISTELIECYRCANYEIGAGFNMIILHIDQYSKQLSQLFKNSNSKSAVLITAFNPLSLCQSSEKNFIAHELLSDVLKHHSSQIIESSSTDPTGIWPAEKGFFAMGLSLNTAKTLGQQFNQNAIVWMDATAIPRLILLSKQL